MLHSAIIILGLIATTISAQNALPNDIRRVYPPQSEQRNNTSGPEFELEALMQISRGTEKFSLDLYKVIAVNIS